MPSRRLGLAAAGIGLAVVGAVPLLVTTRYGINLVILAAAWSMATLGEDLYVGTWHFGSGGKLYRVSRQLVETVDCDDISAANAAWEVCETGDHFCAGVFTDGAGCQAYCAAVGLPATACFGGDSPCVKEAEALDCGVVSGHQTDWCECGYR